MATEILEALRDLREPAEQDDLVIGPMLEPRNNARSAGAGSIHDDATAQKLGFRGGTVAGSIHMEQFPPLLTHIFGDEWWKTGGLSLYFRYATSDMEPVRCFAKKPDGSKANVWMEDSEGHLVAEGTAGIGGRDPESPLRLRIRDTPEPTELRILKDIKVGSKSDPVPTRIKQDVLDQRLEVITEPFELYRQQPAALPPSLMVRIMRAADGQILPRHKDMGVGLFGAIELQHLNGPVYAETDYLCTSEVLAVSETPKTEYIWYEAVLSENDGTEVASMLMMLRFMKASSALWQ